MMNVTNIRKVLSVFIFFTFFYPLSISAQPLAKNKTKFVGNIISNGDGTSQFNTFKKYWNQVTAENAGKWGSVQTSDPNNFGFGQLDNAYNFAKNNNFPYKHHTLIWGQQQPSFLNGLDSASQYNAIVKWIDTVAKRYPNAEMVDVVNEPLPTHAPPDGGSGRANYKKALGGDGVTGWDWVIKSFELARQRFPVGTKLLLNDYSIINSNANTTTYLTIINLLKERNLIDGIGEQAHGFENVSASVIKANLDKLAQTGLPIYITELDLNIQNDAQQLAKYQELFPVMYEHPAVAGITFWGYIYGATWRPWTHLLDDRNAKRPALTWLESYLISPFAPVLISPTNTDSSLAPVLLWHPSDSATSYRVQLSKTNNFAITLIDSVVTDTVFQVDSLEENTRYYWRASASNDKGTSVYSPSQTFLTGSIPMGIEDAIHLPQKYLLSQNYPNPFNPTTYIEYSIPQSGYVSLKVFNVLGEEVATLYEGNLHQGTFKAIFNAGGLASGVYFYRLLSNGFIDTKKLTLLK